MVGVAQDAEVQRVVVGPAVGSIEGVIFRNENMQELAVGESGFVVLTGYKDGETQNCLATQDGRTALTCKRVADSGGDQLFELLNRETPVAVTSLLKLPSATPGGALAALPKVLCDIISDDNYAALKVLHAPAEDQVEGAVKTMLYKEPSVLTEWGDQVTTLLAT